MTVKLSLRIIMVGVGMIGGRVFFVFNLYFVKRREGLLMR